MTRSGAISSRIYFLVSWVRARRQIRDRLFQEYDFPTLMSRSWDTEDEQADGKMFVLTIAPCLGSNLRTS